MSRVLLVTTAPLDRVDVQRVRDEIRLEDTEIRIVAPSVNESVIAYWVSDPDEAIAEAEEVAAESGAAVRSAGGQAQVDVGDSDPRVAIRDALRTFPADRIVVFHRDLDSGDAAYKEDRLQADRLRKEFSLPVSEHVLQAESAG